MNFKIGDRNGHIEIVGESFREKDAIIYPVKCDCGKAFNMRKSNFSCGKGKGCASCAPQNRKFHTKETKRLDTIWRNMVSRCYDERRPDFKSYGGRGISVCNEWADSYSSFKNWAFENGYENNLTLERTNNNSNYEPSNCKWITRAAQCRNVRTNVYYEVDGEKMLQVDMLKKYNITLATLQHRMNIGLSLKEALTLPIGGIRKLMKSKKSL